MMTRVPFADLLKAMCISTYKAGMYASWNPDDGYEVLQAAPWLADLQINDPTVLAEGYAYLLFDSRKEMEECFWSTVGEDGPTKDNSYDGPAKVFAVTCSESGTLMHENT